MAAIATDGKGNYVTLDPSGNWVPTTAPATPQKGGGELGYQAAPPEAEKPTIDFANRPGQPASQQDDLGLPLPQGGDTGAVGRIATAAVRGYQDSPPWLTPAARQQEESTVIGKYGLSPINQLFGAGVGVLSGIGAGIGQGAYELGNAVVGPQLGRDFYMGAQTPIEPGAGYLRMPAAEDTPKFVSERTAPPRAPDMTDASRIQQLVEHNVNEEQPVMGPPMARGPLTEPPPEPLPQPETNRMAPGGSAAQPPPTAPDPAIMTQADMRARGHGYFNAADQAASQGAMLPDTNATAVRKLFGDFIPSDPEAARISAGEPAMQAAKNVDATGPMSYDTAMRIDRDLTSRMRGASGTDAHDLSQLQQSLRDQMDQVPDLDNLRPGRQAWKQSIKQGQMEDINAGAALKNDPAQADTYVRQRAAALLKNDNAMRYWTPEEQAQLTQVAKSGDIGTLGRLSVSLIKPITRVAFGTAGHFVAGPLGAIVGGEVGGDVGATQAGRLRSYLSKTTLDPVMEQITRGVPPPNRLMPQQPP